MIYNRTKITAFLIRSIVFQFRVSGKLLLAFSSTAIRGSDPRGTHDHIFLSIGQVPLLLYWRVGPRIFSSHSALKHSSTQAHAHAVNITVAHMPTCNLSSYQTLCGSSDTVLMSRDESGSHWIFLLSEEVTSLSALPINGKIGTFLFVLYVPTSPPTRLEGPYPTYT